MFASRSKGFCAVLLVAVLLAVVVIHPEMDALARLIGIFALGAFLIEFVALFRGRRQQERVEDSRDRIRRRELERFARLRDCLEGRLAGGQLLRVEEWWEDDELWVDENAHISFVLTDGEEMDFVLYSSIAQELSRLLAEQGIAWQASYRAESASRIIWQR